MNSLIRLIIISCLLFSSLTHASLIFINEFHYDNNGADTNEFIEIAGAGNTNLTGWSLALYNGSNGSIYNTINLFGFLSGDINTIGFASFSFSGIQNGGPDGIALIDNNNLLREFLSYEGAFTASEGIADGILSKDILIEESNSTPENWSLQRTQLDSNSVWEAGIHSKGLINQSQKSANNTQVIEPTSLVLFIFALVIFFIARNSKQSDNFQPI